MVPACSLSSNRGRKMKLTDSNSGGRLNAMLTIPYFVCGQWRFNRCAIMPLYSCSRSGVSRGFHTRHGRGYRA